MGRIKATLCGTPGHLRYNNTWRNVICETTARDSKISGNARKGSQYANMGNSQLKLRNMGQCKSTACGQATLQYISKYMQGHSPVWNWNKLGTAHTFELGTCTTGQWWQMYQIVERLGCLMPQICAEPEDTSRMSSSKASRNSSNLGYSEHFSSTLIVFERFWLEKHKYA